jgi:GR25 family glycosyltransferase involved in LPS biosynthesis
MADFTYRPIKIDEYFDKIFYINMAKDLDRNHHMIEQFKNVGITNYERVEGVELSEIPWKSAWRNFIKHDEKYIKGQLGCRSAHRDCVEIARKR